MSKNKTNDGAVQRKACDQRTDSAEIKSDLRITGFDASDLKVPGMHITDGSSRHLKDQKLPRGSRAYTPPEDTDESWVGDIESGESRELNFER